MVYAALAESSEPENMSASAQVDRTLAALADPTRRAVIEHLRTRPHRAGELADALGMSAPALSRHLRVLRKSGLITDDDVEHDARVRLYRLEPKEFASLREWVTEVAAFGGEQLAGFKAHAERSSRSGE